MKQLLKTAFICIFMAGMCASCVFADPGSLLVLCYHDIPKQAGTDRYATDRASFVQQIEYMRTHGYKFISLDDLMRANRKEKSLPEKAVLLTFDDAYMSFYEFVYPLLKLYGYPCVLAVVTGWIESGTYYGASLMGWRQLREVAGSGLVEIASHSHNLHRGVIYNSMGNDAPAAVSRIYDAASKSGYESDAGYRKRLEIDFILSRKILRDKAGVNARAIVWPYGRYNQICIEEAEKHGFKAMFTASNGLADESNIKAIPRNMLMGNMWIDGFIKGLKRNFVEPVCQRVLQADLDLIYDPDPVQQEKNLDKFIERVFNMGVNTVYLQAFCDTQGDGNISSVYFPNRVLPMRADLFNRVVNQLVIRGIKVYAWMPVLSIKFSDSELNKKLRVRELHGTVNRLSESWYSRLSPFSLQVLDKLKVLYEDMAINANIDGVIFQDDAYLNDFEDFSPAALEEYRKISGSDSISFQQLSEEKQEQWTRAKTQKLTQFTGELKKAVIRYRPQALFARTLYASVLTDPGSEYWLAQNYKDALEAYDYVVIMAYPEMEKAFNAESWLKKIVQKAGAVAPGALEKTVFKVQAYDWDGRRFISANNVDRYLRALVSAGALHVGYYPDDYTVNRPDGKTVRLMMSVQDSIFNKRGLWK